MAIVAELQRLRDIKWHLITAEYHIAGQSLEPAIQELGLQLINMGSV